MRDPPSKTLRMPVHNLSVDYLQWRNSRSFRENFWAPNNESNRHLASLTALEKVVLRDIPRLEVGPAGIGGSPPFMRPIPRVDPDSQPAQALVKVFQAAHEPHKIPWDYARYDVSSGDEGGAVHPKRKGANNDSDDSGSVSETGEGESALESTPERRAERGTERRVGRVRERDERERGGRGGRGRSARGGAGERGGVSERGGGAGKPSKRPESAPASGKSHAVADMVTGHRVREMGEVARRRMARDEPWRLSRVDTHGDGSTMRVERGKALPRHAAYGFYKYYGFAGQGAKTSWAHNPKYGPMEAQYYGPAQIGHDVKGAKLERMSVTRSTEFLRRSKAEILAEERRVRATRVDLVTGAEVTKKALRRLRTAPGSSEDRRSRASLEEGIRMQPWRKAHVLTHRAPAAYEGTCPYHATYQHYKYYGFAGQGARTSHALNPKLTKLKLLQSDQEDLMRSSRGAEFESQRAKRGAGRASGAAAAGVAMGAGVGAVSSKSGSGGGGGGGGESRGLGGKGGDRGEVGRVGGRGGGGGGGGGEDNGLVVAKGGSKGAAAGGAVGGKGGGGGAGVRWSGEGAGLEGGAEKGRGGAVDKKAMDKNKAEGGAVDKAVDKSRGADVGTGKGGVQGEGGKGREMEGAVVKGGAGEGRSEGVGKGGAAMSGGAAERGGAAGAGAGASGSAGASGAAVAGPSGVQRQ